MSADLKGIDRGREGEAKRREKDEKETLLKNSLLLTPPSLLLKIPEKRRLLLNIQQRLINLFLRELRWRLENVTVPSAEIWALMSFDSIYQSVI